MPAPRFNRFDSIAKIYEDTKPIRGRSEDVRPLFARRYTWQRIEKYDENTYLLHDGMWGGGTSSATHGSRKELVPIMWERRADGDYITIRNCPNNAYSVSRYNFLSWCLPQGMYFWFENGKHYVKHNNTDHFLAKFKCNFDYRNGTFDMVEDNKIVFKHDPVTDTFTRANELQPKKTRRLDKDLKAKYDPMIAELWQWAQAVLPILGESMCEGKTRGEYSQSLCQSGYWYWQRTLESKDAREILENPEHDKRLAFTALCAFEAGAFGFDSYRNHEEVSRLFNPTPKAYSEFKKVVRKAVDVFATELC